MRKIAGYTFHLLSHASETTCFALMGLSVFLMDFPMEQWGLMLGVLALCLVSRPMAVYPLLGLVSCSLFMCLVARLTSDTGAFVLLHS